MKKENYDIPHKITLYGRKNNTHALAHEKLGVGDTRDIKLKSELILFKDIHCESYFCCVHSYTCYMRV